MPSDPGPRDLVAGPDMPFGDDAQVEAGPVVRDEQGGQLGFAESHADAKTRDARLCDLELGLTDAIPVADVDVVVAESVDREVLPELADLEVVAAEVILPVAVRLDLVDEHSALLTTVSVEISLAVAVDVEPTRYARPSDGALPDPGVDRAPVPGDILG
jgi:hypothetical protein